MKTQHPIRGRTIRPEAILGVTMDNVVRVYSGRPGCGCGCRGKYTTPEENKGVVTRVLRHLQRNVDCVTATRTGHDEWCFALETDTRYHWVYVTFRFSECWKGSTKQWCPVHGYAACPQAN